MAAEEEKPQGQGFTVQDRRRFSPETGEVRQDAPESNDQPSPSVAPNATADQTTAEPRREELPPIDFSTFVMSLSTEALMHLGEIANPLSGKMQTDVSVAKQMIDILGMLKEKTRGNLSASEDRMMEEILFDLRMKYVEAVKKR